LGSYKLIKAKKDRLTTLYYLQTLFYVSLAAVEYTAYTGSKRTFTHPAIFAGLLLPVLGRAGTRSNTASYLLVYSFLATCCCAYMLYAGVGRMATVVNVRGITQQTALALAVYGFGALTHFLAMLTSRQLVVLMDNSANSNTGTSAAKRK
jgi:hypothetical protein